MKTRVLMSAVMALSLAACGQDEPAEAKQETKSFGAGVGETYKGMLDDAKQSVELMNEQQGRREREIEGQAK